MDYDLCSEELYKRKTAELKRMKKRNVYWYNRNRKEMGSLKRDILWKREKEKEKMKEAN